MQLQDMVARVRKTLGEVEPNGYNTQSDGNGSWDNWQIIGYLNEALSIMAHAWRKEKLGSISINSIGQTDFPIPADALEDGMRVVSYATGGTAYPMKYVDLDTYNNYATGQSLDGAVSYIYTIWAGTVKIWPGAASVNDTLQPYYYRIPAALSAASDVPEIPVRFHQAPIYYAIKECQNAVEEVNLESDADRKWQMELMRFRLEMAKNQRDQGIRVRGRR